MYVGPLTEIDVLASQLFALHEEALGEPHSWLDLKPEQREAWIQVAQFVEARKPDAPPILHMSLKDWQEVTRIIENPTQFTFNRSDEPDHK